MQIKQILTTIQEQLSTEVTSLAEVSKDRGQLYYESSAVNFPCALLDIHNQQYSQQAHGGGIADTQIAILVADIKLDASATISDTYRLVEIIEQVCEALTMLHVTGCAPLVLSGVNKVIVGNYYECYRITFQTSYTIAAKDISRRIPVQTIKLDVAKASE